MDEYLSPIERSARYYRLHKEEKKAAARRRYYEIKHKLRNVWTKKERARAKEMTRKTVYMSKELVAQIEKGARKLKVSVPEAIRTYLEWGVEADE